MAKNKVRVVSWMAPYMGPFSAAEARTSVAGYYAPKTRSGKDWVKSAKRAGIVAWKAKKLKGKKGYQVYAGLNYKW